MGICVRLRLADLNLDVGQQSGAFLAKGSHLDFAEKKRLIMRSDLIFGALTHVNNRYQLCQLASKATRKLHKPNTRLQDTTNEVLDRFKDAMPMGVVGSEEQETLAAVRRAA